MDETDKLQLYHPLKRISKSKSTILRDPGWRKLRGKTITLKKLERLRKLLRPYLKTRADALQESTAYLLEGELTAQEINSLVWRLVANELVLQTGQPVYPWSSLSRNEWMPLQILEMTPHRTKRGKVGQVIRCIILAGSAASLECETYWSSKFCAYIAQKFGFSKPYKDYRYVRPQDLVRLWFYGEFIAAKSNLQDGPIFENISIPKFCEESNKALIKKRYRKGFECPEGYTHACALCPVGYDKCLCGTHPRTYSLRLCDKCKEESWHDDGDHRNPNLCVDCWHRYLLRPKTEQE